MQLGYVVAREIGDRERLAGIDRTEHHLDLAPRVSSAALFTALVGSLWVSRLISSIWRPSIPPAALISCTAIATPRLMPIPVDDEGPVSAGR